VRADLPAKLFELIYNYTLHDSIILSFTETRSAPGVFLILDGCRNGNLADTDRVVFSLHFINSKCNSHFLRSFIDNEILYAEVISGEARRWKFNALTTKDKGKDFFSIEFDDFGYYLYDYRSLPEAQQGAAANP
jgi:hypothetical protein